MKRKRLFRWLLLPGMMLSVLRGIAQDTFAYEAPLDTIAQAGFYKIILTPKVVAKCRQDLSDVRIRDPHGQFTPYVLQSDFPTLTGETFSEFPILPVKKEADSTGDVQIAHWSAGPIHSLLLYIRNISVRRNCTLSGSDDGHKWFVIKEHIPLEPSYADNMDYYIQRIDFPASNYRFFKIIQEEKGALPVNIFRAGVATQHAGSGRYRLTPAPEITQKDSSNHHSYITLTYHEPYLIEHLEVEIKGPALYKRKVRLFSKEDPSMDVTFDIDPANHSFQLPPTKGKILVMDISNEDNAPLVVSKVATSQLERYLLTWLQPGAGYRLLMGNAQAAAPTYDLKYFVDSVSREPVAIIPGRLLAVSKPAAPPAASKDRSGVMLWVIISIVLVLLVFLSIKMLKAIPGNQQKEDKQ